MGNNLMEKAIKYSQDKNVEPTQVVNQFFKGKTFDLYGNKLTKVKPYQLTYFLNGCLDSIEFSEESELLKFMAKTKAVFCQPNYEGRPINSPYTTATAKEIALSLT